MEKEKKENLTQKENVSTEIKPKKKSKVRMILVIIFILLFAIIMYVQARGSYLEYLELGENYVQVFWTNILYRYAIMAINFVFLFFVI